MKVLVCQWPCGTGNTTNIASIPSGLEGVLTLRGNERARWKAGRPAVTSPTRSAPA